jgi:PAS domain S-box-containing protein
VDREALARLHERISALEDELRRRRSAEVASEQPLLAGGGVMGELIRTKDWDESKLGPPSTWPQSLRTALSIALSSRFPMIIFWGDDLCVLYNDAYIPIFGAKHPETLGKTGFEAWGEVWEVIAPMFERVRSGEATWSKDQLLGLHRRGFTEEAYFTWSYSPIIDEAGRVGGVFTAVQETTARVLAERRLAILRDLGEQVAEAKTIHEACAASIETFSKNAHDVPFAAIYLAEGDDLDRFRRVGIAGVDDGPMPLTVGAVGP